MKKKKKIEWERKVFNFKRLAAATLGAIEFMERFYLYRSLPLFYMYDSFYASMPPPPPLLQTLLICRISPTLGRVFCLRIYSFHCFLAFLLAIKRDDDVRFSKYFLHKLPSPFFSSFTLYVPELLHSVCSALSTLRKCVGGQPINDATEMPPAAHHHQPRRHMTI